MSQNRRKDVQEKKHIDFFNRMFLISRGSDKSRIRMRNKNQNLIIC